MFSVRLRPMRFMLLVNALMLIVLSLGFVQLPSDAFWWHCFGAVLVLGAFGYFMRALLCLCSWLTDFGSSASQRHVEEMAAHLRWYAYFGGGLYLLCVILRCFVLTSDLLKSEAAQLLTPIFLMGIWGVANIMLSLGAIALLYSSRVNGEGYKEIERRVFGEDIS